MGSGGDLKGRKDKTPALTRGQVIKYAMDILTGIDHMHQRRIYHMDMKPENVVLCKGDIAKIIDFGFSKTRILEESKKDMFDDVQWSGIGTKGYISPESWNQGAISKEDDLAKRDSYAVGMTIFNALLSPYCKWKEFDDSITGDTDSKILSGRRIDHLIKLLRDEANRKKLLSDGLLILADAASGLIEENPKIRLTCRQALEFLKADRKQHRQVQMSGSKDALTSLKELHFVRDRLKKSRD
jgi:serine/threonine protein kinase